MSARDIWKIVIAVLMFSASIAFAVFDPVNDDTDIFLANPNIPAERPNVLIVLDNTANWNQAFANEKSALVQVINGLTDAFNVGLMMFPETGSPNDSVDGAYVRYHVRRMTSTNKIALSTLVNNLDINSDKGNNATTGLALHEAFLYFSGRNSIASHGKIKTDKDGTADPLLSPLTEHALPAGTISAPYRSPIKDGCARSFVIYISNGPAAENASARSDLEAKLATLTGVTPPSIISITPGGLQGNWADEMAKFMANADVMSTSAGVPNSEQTQNVYTYVVEVDPAGTGQGPDMTALMKSVAANGKGKYFGVTSASSGTGIVDALNAIFTEVQAVNSVFASTTLPVSVNVRGTNLNQVYIGVFRPDSTKSPRWMGNLKMYNLALNSATGSVFLADAANGPPPAVGNSAENTTTGFVSQNSPSFWTSSSTFWGFRDPSQNGPGGPSDFPDGDLVEKGGAAQQLRISYAGAEASATPRKLYTCTTGDIGGTPQTCAPNSGFQLSTTPFNTANAAIDAAALQLDTRLVSPLTAYATKPITNLVDRRPVSLVNSFGGVDVTSLNNGATTRTLTNLTTAAPKNVTALSGLVSGTITVNVATGSGITVIAKDG
jgi:type IV pilus assembly protein PilY1